MSDLLGLCLPQLFTRLHPPNSFENSGQAKTQIEQFFKMDLDLIQLHSFKSVSQPS